jgi:hypothetical protein
MFVNMLYVAQYRGLRVVRRWYCLTSLVLLGAGMFSLVESLEIVWDYEC